MRVDGDSPVGFIRAASRLPFVFQQPGDQNRQQQ